MKTFGLIVLVALALVVPAGLSAQTAPKAIDVTGTWNANFTRTAPDGRTQTIPFVFVLAQKGKALTGTISPDAARVWKIEKGVVDADKVTFQVQQPDGPLRTFTLKLEKGELKGIMKAELDGQSFEAVVAAQKAK